MSDVQKGADALEQLSRTVGEPLAQVGAVLRRMGSLEAYEKEIQGRLVTLKDREDQALAAATAAEERHESVKATVLDTVAKATVEAERMRADAVKEAGRLVEEARKKVYAAEMRVQDAERSASERQDEVRVAQVELARLQKDIKAARAEIKTMLGDS